MIGHRGRFAHKHSGIKSSVLGNKVFLSPSIEEEGLGGLRQCNSGGLPQQARGDSLTGNVSYGMATDVLLQPQSNFGKGSTHPGLSECDSRQPFTQGQGHTDRVVSSSQIFQRICQIWHRPMIDLFSTKMNNNYLFMYLQSHIQMQWR